MSRSAATAYPLPGLPLSLGEPGIAVRFEWQTSSFCRESLPGCSQLPNYQITQLPNSLNYPITNLVIDQSLPAQYQCFQSPPPRPRSGVLRTFEVKLEGWHMTANACARAAV